jgi:hypothetical protein
MLRPERCFSFRLFDRFFFAIQELENEPVSCCPTFDLIRREHVCLSFREGGSEENLFTAAIFSDRMATLRIRRVAAVDLSQAFQCLDPGQRNVAVAWRRMALRRSAMFQNLVM